MAAEATDGSRTQAVDPGENREPGINIGGNGRDSLMKFKEYIQKEILLRLQKSNVMVVYDPEFRYSELCLELASDTLRVIDASAGSITSREAALLTLKELGDSGTKLSGMLVYVPAKPPLEEEEKQNDPFALYTVCGAVFPDPAKDRDSYLELAKLFKPDYLTEITKIFNANPNPQFAVLDAIGGGSSWPNLKALLGLDSARDILFTILAPSDDQKDCFRKQDSWVAEAEDLFAICLGLQLVTRSKTWDTIAMELWRYLLFSEFAFDLPGDLPDALSNVPRAPEEACSLVKELCDRLRNDRRTKALYVDQASEIEKIYQLPTHCSGIKDLGIRDTFPFEEQSFFNKAITALLQDELDTARTIVNRRQQSVWMGKEDSQAQWNLIQAVVILCEKCDDNEPLLPDYSGSLETLIDFYTGRLREVDRYQREFEQAVADFVDISGVAVAIVKQTRRRYRRLMDKVQSLFLRQVEKDGWPLVGRLANTDIFAKKVAPKLQQSGYRVAYLMIDALRYELGIELEKQLVVDDKVELQTALAQLPSVTPVGMAGLLPDAGLFLTLTHQAETVVPMIGEVKLTNVMQRMDFLRQKYGQRFSEMTLSQFLNFSQGELPDSVELLVLRSTDIDNQMESTPEFAFGLISNNLKRIRVALNKLKLLGFQEAIIATDHGFCLNVWVEAGDVCAKPPGTWINVHERMLLGDGTADQANLVLRTEQLGIRGDFAQAAVPRSMTPYRAGMSYYHGGLSLQEGVVPVLTVRLQKEELEAGKPNIMISYKSGAKRITTRLPVVEIKLEAADLFSTVGTYEILLEAQDSKGTVVGEAKLGGLVNPATGTVVLKPGDVIQVPIRMQPEFEGKFTIKALNPATLASYCQISLETDYMDGV
jgi:hypothetical protein